MIELVKKPQILQKWNTLTISERCEEIAKELNIRINYRLLYDIYKGLGIKLRRPQQVYIRSRSELVELTERRRAFASSLQSLIEEEANIIYMDETTVSAPIFTLASIHAMYALNALNACLHKERNTSQ